MILKGSSISGEFRRPLQGRMNCWCLAFRGRPGAPGLPAAITVQAFRLWRWMRRRLPERRPPAKLAGGLRGG
jgi:hypothetical protein